MPDTLHYARPFVPLPEQTGPRRSAGEAMPGSGVVVGTDGSYLGDRAVAWAARHASMLGDVLHVYQSTGAHAGAVAHGVNQVVHAYPDLSVERHFIDAADPLEALVEAGTAARLVAVGARGRNHPGLGLGHLVRPLAARALCPVAVVKGHPDAIRGRYATVSVAVGRLTDEVPLALAVEMAAREGAGLRVIHAETGPDDDVMSWALARATELHPEVRIDIHARRCLPHEFVAAITDTDLLVVGRGGTRGQAGTGRVTNEALFHAPCPVVVAPV
ncbi:universal stress protein [Actinokineospora xionganensis]|uniref:Universal stress protein n=1 Tax=Actinokineospora xionganensis TaxID=2684470 RepID=A0ABR7L7K9_9PSEU|nr:universal stress protein [Actinokineospora xionganensis]MBC6448679.1 universal stress protein [Actinokineospora xionganensis]